MLCGRLPFYNRDHEVLFQLILNVSVFSLIYLIHHCIIGFCLITFAHQVYYFMPKTSMRVFLFFVFQLTMTLMLNFPFQFVLSNVSLLPNLLPPYSFSSSFQLFIWVSLTCTFTFYACLHILNLHSFLSMNSVSLFLIIVIIIPHHHHQSSSLLSSSSSLSNDLNSNFHFFSGRCQVPITTLRSF